MSRHYTIDPVFVDLSCQIESGERIGLVGPNGAGKSTLLKLLSRAEPPDGGSVSFHPDVNVGVLSQFVDVQPDVSLLAEVRRAMQHLVDWHDRMILAGEQMAGAGADDERQRHAKDYDRYQELLRHHGGYDFDHRIEEVLFGLQFQKADFDRLVRTFSGGQQSRIMLAKLLLQAPDLFLLDEPTNHLDIATTEWLEDYLRRQESAMLIVSHDRTFLDHTVTKIWEMHAGRLSVYPGNFREYAALRSERAKSAERAYSKQQDQIAHYQDFVRKNKAGQLSKMAKAREKMIERLEANAVDLVREIRGPRMGFGDVSRTGDIVVTVKGLGKQFDYPLFTDVDFEIQRGERVGIIGPNGAGKSTLIKILLGLEPATAGEIRLGQNVRVGYLDQDLTQLDLTRTPLEEVRPPWRLSEKDEPFRGLLARFGIMEKQAEQSIATLSGGERTRTALAKLVAYECNLIVLDEPTNHLDLWSCEALEDSLLGFEGTVIVISHDRTFLNAVTERLFVVSDGRIVLIPGNYDEYLEWRARQQAALVVAKEPSAPTPTKTEAKRKRKYPFRKTSEIEADIADHESRIGDLEAMLHMPEVYKDGRKTRETTELLLQLKSELETLMDHWAEAMDLNPR